jgi:hypothetical protein
MGVPVKLTLDGKALFICCEGCKDAAAADPPGMFSAVEELKAKRPAGPPRPAPGTDPGAAKIRDALARLSPEDRRAAEAQRLCPIQEEPLGSMGVPLKIDLGGGRSVFICCKGCEKRVLKDPDAALRKVEDFKQRPAAAGGKP